MLLTRQVTFIGGKGGVGKTTVAAAAALAAADRGLATLLVSTDPAHSTSDILEVDLADEARSVTGTLDAMELDPEREANRYIDQVKERIADAVPPRLVYEVERQIDIASVSPGAEEAALFDRFTRVLEQASTYEHIVFDTAPTGHTLRLLGLPEQMTAWMSGLIQRRRKVTAMGRMWRNVSGAAATTGSFDDPILAALEERRHRYLQTRELVTDSARAEFLFVLIPRRLPVLETRRAVSTLHKYGIPVRGVVINRADDVPSTDPPAVFNAAEQPPSGDGWREEFPDLVRWELPTFARELVGLDALRRVARELRRTDPDQMGRVPG